MKSQSACSLPSAPNAERGVAPTARHEDAAFARKGTRLPEDTVEGCRANASLDLAHASTMGSANSRWKYERSAASWTERADLLQRVIDDREADSRLD
jgi:hypothetical protein